MSFLVKLKNFLFTKRFLKYLGIIAFIYIIVVGGTLLYLNVSTNHGQKIEVPSLVGMNVKNIASIVEGKGLKYEVLDSIYMPNKPEGTILSQDPRCTDSSDVFVKEGRIIKLQVSKRTRMVEMPSLIDKSEHFAVSVLKNRGLKYTVNYEETSEQNGAVLNQRLKGQLIEEGVRIPIGSTIQLTVGRNTYGQAIQLPNLYGLTINEVKLRLSEIPSLRLNINCEECFTANDSLQVRVNSQSPEYAEGIMSSSNTTISINMKKVLDPPIVGE